jgi:membrane protease YdiL (CAAX protease family)
MGFWPFSKLRDPQASFLTVVLLGWLAATLPAVVLVQAAQLFVPPDAPDAIAEKLFPEEIPFWVGALGVVVFAPVVETAMMGGLFFLSRKLGAGTRTQIAVQVVFWAVLHGIQAPLWAIGPGWIFFVLALIWTGQREAGLAKAFWAVALVHALNNGIATAAIAAQTFAGAPGPT